MGKRSKHAEMEKQIDRLKRNLERAQAQGFVPAEEEDQQVRSPSQNGVYPNAVKNESFMGSDEAVSSLLHLKQGGSYIPRYPYEIENVGLTHETANELFHEFFTYYHPWLPFLDPDQPPNQYMTHSNLLFWSIIVIASRRYDNQALLNQLSPPLTRLLWSTISEVPHNHQVVKAMCLLCTWPLPASTTSSDPTHILSGVMMKTATGIGLHRPSHTQDFSRVSVDLSKEQLHDRVVTWAVCNIVAQSIGTGYGQPATTLYDWTLAVRPGDDGPFTLTTELEARLQIERFCDKVSKEMYSNATDPRGVVGDEVRATLTRVYRREFSELSTSILSRNEVPPLVKLHLQAAGLHLRLAAFFDSSTTHGYMDDLMGLWRACVSFLTCLFELEDAPAMPRRFMAYCTNYIFQMVIAAGFTLLKLLSSFFANYCEFEQGRDLFHKVIQAVRDISVVNNDLPWRLAELMVQMWNGARVETRNRGISSEVDDSLQLKVRCRMSMSLVFDSIWRWREEYQSQGRGTLEGKSRDIRRRMINETHILPPALKPTHPDSSTEHSGASSHTSGTHLDSTLMPLTSGGAGPQSSNVQSGLAGASGSLGGSMTPSAGLGLGYGESNYEVFDPLTWMLDGLVEFPYSYPAMQGLEAGSLS